MVKILIKLFLLFNSVLFLLFGIGFSFDTGSDIEIAGKVLFLVISWLLFVYLLWRKEIRGYIVKYGKSQTLRVVLKFVIAIIATIALIGFMLGFASIG